jgi:hypothetical protein
MSCKHLPFVFLAIATAAAGAEFEPKIALSVIRTDNLTLVPLNPESATVYQLTPEFTVTQDSTRLDATASYRLSAYRYDERGENEVYNEFDGELVFGVVPEKFFLNMGANRTQSIVDPESTIPIDNLAITTNRVDRDDYYAGPSFQVPVGANTVVSGELRRTWVKYAEAAANIGAFDDFNRDMGKLSVDNYRKGAGLTWALGYDYQHTDYGKQFVPYEYRQATAELGTWAGDRTRLFVAGGQESPWDRPLEPALADSFWETGVVREVGKGFRAEFAVGERSFGKSRRGGLFYNFGRGTTALTYSERPTTNAEDLFSRAGLLDPNVSNDYLFRAGSIERYVSELLQWEFNLELQRTVLQLSMFDESRVDLTDTTGAPLGDEQQSGANLSVTWKLGAKTQFYLRGMRIDRQFSSGDDSDFTTETVGASYSLGRRTQIALQVEQREQVSKEFAAQNYSAELISLIVSRTF